MELFIAAHRRDTGWEPVLDPRLDSEQTLILVFGDACAPNVEGAFAELGAMFPSSHIAGCSTAGEILGAAVQDESLCVALLRFETTRLRHASASVAGPQDSFDAGCRLGRELLAPDLRGLLVFSDGLNVNGTSLVRGLNSVLPPEVCVTGGLAADGDRFVQTWVASDGRLTANVVTAAALYGDRVEMGHGSEGGWDIFGPERTVTKAAGNVLYELDGRPALDLYKQYLGARAAGLPATALLFPLAVRANPASDDHVVRTVLGVDQASNSLTFAGDIPEGARAQLMRANFDRLVDGASAAAARAHLRTGETAGPLLCLAISCVGRRLILGQRTDEELEATLDALPDHARQIGFYSYGELSPFASGHCDLHNQTMTITTISERAA